MADCEEDKQKRVAIFLVNSSEQDYFYYYDQIPLRYKEHKGLANSLLKLRNILIVLTIIEIFAALWGFSYYFIRRVRIT